MKTYFLSLFNKVNRKTTFLFLLLSVILVIVAIVMGITDNVPAILVLFTGIVLFVATFIHIWRRIRSYLILALIFALAFPIFVVLHNIISGISGLITENVWLISILGFFDAFAFILAVIICPAAVIAGLLGALILFVKDKKLGAGMTS